MRIAFSNRTQTVMSLATEHARRLQHDFIGTEHILLGLLAEPSGEIASLLREIGTDPVSVENEIEKLILRGARVDSAGKLPLTPLAAAAIDRAQREAPMLSQRRIEPGHLLFGLVMQAGVASLALQNLRVDLGMLLNLIVKARLEQMAIIERVVRPVRTRVSRKRKIREELLSHLEGIFEEELAEGKNRFAALAAAVRRFGDSDQLSLELDRSVSWPDRVSFYAERWFGWRAPESVLKYLTRLAIRTAILLMVMLFPIAVMALLLQGWNAGSPVGLRMIAAAVMMIPAAQFSLGFSYYKMRDSLWGVFGSRRSLPKVLLFFGVIALMIFAAILGFVGIAGWSRPQLASDMPGIFGLSILSALVCACQARFRGPIEIRDTIWACL